MGHAGLQQLVELRVGESHLAQPRSCRGQRRGGEVAGAGKLHEFPLRGLQLGTVEIKQRLARGDHGADDVNVKFFHPALGPGGKQPVTGIIVVDRAVDTDGAQQRLARDDGRLDSDGVDDRAGERDHALGQSHSGGGRSHEIHPADRAFRRLVRLDPRMHRALVNGSRGGGRVGFRDERDADSGRRDKGEENDEKPFHEWSGEPARTWSIA